MTSTATGSGVGGVDYGVLVGPVSVPAAVDRPEMVVQVSPNRVELDEFNRWAAPLSENIARVVAGNLSALLGTPHVAVAPLANFDARYRVTIDVQRFDTSPGQSVSLDAVWTVHTTGTDVRRSGRTVTTEAVHGQSYDELAAAHSRALGRMSDDIADAIRQLASSGPGSR